MAQHPPTRRYPAGTAANSWEWRAACEIGANCHGNNNTLAALRSFVTATGTTPIFVLNMLTSTLSEQIAFLTAAAAYGLGPSKIELGNED